MFAHMLISIAVLPMMYLCCDILPRSMIVNMFEFGKSNLIRDSWFRSINLLN